MGKLDAINNGNKNNKEWSDDDMTGLRDTTFTSLNPKFLDSLDEKLATMISAFAINTCAYYMVEFRDEVNEKWMMGFLNFKQVGFPDGKWTNYIEKMINMDKQHVEVFMQCSKSVLRARKIPDGANVVMQYFHELEPRKIAHKILTIREDVSNEMIEDLGCIVTENVEIVRFAKLWAKEGRETAGKSRKLTRIKSQGGNTPMRDKNYMDMDVLITHLAMGLVRDGLLKANDDTALATLSTLERKMETDDDARSLLERMLNDAEGPRQFLEELYYKGVTEGVSMKRPDGAKVVNILRVAESLLEARYSIAKEATKILSQQSLQSRHYYRMIKDLGGFTKLDFSKPKFQLVDLDKLDQPPGDLPGGSYEASASGFRSIPNTSGSSGSGGSSGSANANAATTESVFATVSTGDGKTPGATPAPPATGEAAGAAMPQDAAVTGPEQNDDDDDADVFSYDTFGSGPMLM